MNSNDKGMRAGFATVTTLFFMWGFITVSVDPLIAALKAIFKLTYAEVMLSQVAFFTAYFVVSLPAAALISRLGNSKSIIFALGVMIVGCLIIPAATHFDTFELVLVALFVIAGGITILQVAANPLAALLGPPERSHFRLTFSQAFNSFGTFLAPYIVAGVLLTGGIFELSKGCTKVTDAQRATTFANIDHAFFMIAGALVLLAIFIFVFRRHLDVAEKTGPGKQPSVLTALKSPWAIYGGIAIFLYVGAEVSIGSAMTNFLNYQDMLGVTMERAGKLVSFYWGGAMIGRFIGSWLLTRVPAAKLLMIFAALAAVLCLFVSQMHGDVASYAALSIGLFNSIMFPVIFTLTLERSTASTSATSGFLCLAIVGGAVLPYLFGKIADVIGGKQEELACTAVVNMHSSIGLHMAYLLPMAAYVLISIFAMRASKAAIVSHTVTSAAGH
ncbi:MAG TPA: sugar MFS transporter [Steroidobacteraceae bacterium]|jgi:FHS family L-fucose permease-like MFS transporter|nr:sugar MFS transporter [Steroidobacteraceae bacterium]